MSQSTTPPPLEMLGDPEEIDLETLDSPFTIADAEPKPERVTADEAVMRSQSHELSFGLKSNEPAKLEPFSRTRQVGAQCLGVEIFNNPLAWAELDEKGTYNGILKDAILVVYLCLSSPSVSKKAARIPGRICDDALDWWERFGGDVGSKKHGELMETFSMIVGDVFAVMAETEGDGSPDDEDSLGES